MSYNIRIMYRAFIRYFTLLSFKSMSFDTTLGSYSVIIVFVYRVNAP